MHTLNENDVKRIELVGRSCKVLVGKGELKAENLTFGVTEVPAKTKMQPHRHVQEEVIFVLSGYGETNVDGSVERLEVGTVILLPSNSEHWIENKSDETMKFTFAFSPTVEIGSYG